MRNHYLEQAIFANKHRFSATDLVIADFFSKNGDTLINKTIVQLAKEIAVSETSIFNFVKKIGFSGFQQFKLNIATNTLAPSQPIPAYILAIDNEINENDSPLDIAKKVIHTNITSLSDMLTTLNSVPLQKIIEIIDSSCQILFAGMGGSSIIALDSYHKFLRTKYSCLFNSDYHIQLTVASKLTKNDCAIIFSHSGETKETISLAKQLRKNGVKIISLTGNINSQLKKISDAYIVINTQESLFRTESLTSRILYLSMIDIIYINLMVKDIETNLDSIHHIRESLNITKTNHKV